MDDNNFDPWLAFLALSAIANASYDIKMPSEQPPCVYNPGMQQAKQEDIDYLNLKNAYESLAHNPGKKFDDGKIFIDHTKIMLALGRARHVTDETGFGVIEPIDLEEDDDD